jgi:uncharacterized protein YuzE
MKTRYFSDTDTLLLKFGDSDVKETRDLNENIMGEFDANGTLVSITIEHIKELIT